MPAAVDAMVRPYWEGLRGGTATGKDDDDTDPEIGAALENSRHVIKKNSLFVPRIQKKRRKKKGKLATPEVKPEPPPSPISSQRHHIDCGDDFAMLVPKVTDLAT
jgi:hypothetical protein